MDPESLTNDELLSDLLAWHMTVVTGAEEHEERFYELLQEAKRRMSYFEHLGGRI